MRTTLALGPLLAVGAYASPLAKPADVVIEGTSSSNTGLLLAGPPIARMLTSSASTASSTDTTEEFPAGASPVIRSTEEAPEDVSAQHEKRDPAKVRYYREAAVNRHNIHRANHGAPPVTWDPVLAQAALKSAKRCTFAHFVNENGLTYGQNLALGSPANDIAGIISDGWYSEVVYFKGNYGQAQPDYGTNYSKFSKWGHFTQVVWKGSTKIGCATWRCKSVKTSATDSTPMPAAYGGDVTYCNYQAPGNYGGEYAANVGRPKTTQNIAEGYGVNQTAIGITYGQFTGQKWPASAI